MKFTGFTPHPKQREMINQILDSPAKFHVACVARQFGKSMLAMNLCLYWGINKGPCKILWVSPVYSQAEKVMKELMSAIGNSGLVKSCNFSSNEINLMNGTQLLFRSAERYDNIRGLTCDYGVIDEAAFCKDEAWQEAIRPVFMVRGRTILFVSTPKGKNWFWDLFQLGRSDDYPNYAAYTGTSYDTPFINREEIEDAKKTLPELVFQQEYLAKFIDSGGEVFQNIEKNQFSNWSTPQGKVFCGIDLGKQQDFTCAVFIDSQGKVVDMYRENSQEWTTMTNEILTRIRKWNATTMVEVNSIGDVIFEQIKREWQDTIPFVTTSKSKQEIVEGLILDMNDTRIQIPNEKLVPALSQELEQFTYDYNPKTRSIKYGHPRGGHDDTVIALCIANYNRKQNRTIGSYAVMGGY